MIPLKIYEAWDDLRAWLEESTGDYPDFSISPEMVLEKMDELEAYYE